MNQSCKESWPTLYNASDPRVNTFVVDNLGNMSLKSVLLARFLENSNAFWGNALFTAPHNSIILRRLRNSANGSGEAVAY
jgi:hypothetical protein